MSHWTDAYHLKPYAPGAQGPQAYDCLGLWCAVQREQFGRAVALPGGLLYDTTEQALAALEACGQERNNWVPTDLPQPGDTVLFARRRATVHIGIVAVAGVGQLPKILHASNPQGVLLQTPQQCRFAGWNSLRFYRHV